MVENNETNFKFSGNGALVNEVLLKKVAEEWITLTEEQKDKIRTMLPEIDELVSGTKKKGE